MLEDLAEHPFPERWTVRDVALEPPAPAADEVVPDVRGTLTPQLDAKQDTTLLLVDLGKGQRRMGGSILAQTLDQVGDRVPDLDDAQDLVRLVAAVNELRSQGAILAYHDRSDGGLFAAVCEMAFAGHVGVSLNVDLLVTEGDGISDSRAEYGDAKNWANQVSARREELRLSGGRPRSPAARACRAWRSARGGTRCTSPSTVVA